MSNMDRLIELEKQLDELSAQYQDISEYGTKDLDKIWPLFDEIKKSAYEVQTDMFVDTTRQPNGRIKGRGDIEFDIHEISQISTKIDEITDRAYAEIHRIIMQRDQKKELFKEYGSRAIELRGMIRTNNAAIAELEGKISELRHELGDPNLSDEMREQLAAQGIEYTPSDNGLRPEKRYMLERELAAKTAALEEYRTRTEEYVEEERKLVDAIDAIRNGGTVPTVYPELEQEQVETEGLVEGEELEEGIQRGLTPNPSNDDEMILVDPAYNPNVPGQGVGTGTSGTGSEGANTGENGTPENDDEMILVDPAYIPPRPGTGETGADGSGEGENGTDPQEEEPVETQEGPNGGTQGGDGEGGSGEGDNETGTDPQEEEQIEGQNGPQGGGEEGEGSEDSGNPEDEEVEEELPGSLTDPEQEPEEPVQEGPEGPGAGGTGDNTNPPEETEPEQEEAPVMPIVKGNKPKVTWKTVAATAIGIGIGAGVFFAAGPLGVGIMSLAGGIAKKFINKKRKELASMQRVGGSQEVEEIREPKTGIKGAFARFKNYLKSEEGLRDMSWMINAAIITGVGLSVGSAIHNAVNQATVPTEPIGPEPLPEPVPEPIVQEPDVLGFEDIKIGSEVDGFNVTTGHDTAGWAVNNVNPETLASQYVNGDSIFNRFAAINPDGTLGQVIDTQGLSLTEFCAQTGMDPSQIAVDVARADGASQAWISASELVSGIGGPTM